MTLAFKSGLDPQSTWQMFQIAYLLVKDNNCAKLFWNPCINGQVIARASSTEGHFIISPLSVTLTFNVPEQIVQFALLLLKKKKKVPGYFELYA